MLRDLLETPMDCAFGGSVINTYFGNFPAGMVHDYRAEGRERNLLHLVTGGTRIYETESERFPVSAGTLLLIPDKTRYRTVSEPGKDSPCSGIGLRFSLFDASGSEIVLPCGVYRQKTGDYGTVLQMFREIGMSEFRGALHRTVLLLRILDAAVNGHRVYEEPVGPALRMMAERYRENLPVEVYAEACHMSVSWFRKRFVATTGCSPVEYRNRLRFDEARRLFQQGVGTQEIAERTGFCDAGYLLRVYRRQCGVSLKEDAGSQMV